MVIISVLAEWGTWGWGGGLEGRANSNTIKNNFVLLNILFAWFSIVEDSLKKATFGSCPNFQNATSLLVFVLSVYEEEGSLC